MWFLTHVWIIPALMALSFLLILFFGKKLPRKGSEIGIAAVGICFVLALVTAGSWWNHTNDHPARSMRRGCRSRLRLLQRRPKVRDPEAEAEALSDVEEGCSRVADGLGVTGEDGDTALGARPRRAASRPRPDRQRPPAEEAEGEGHEADQAGRPLRRLVPIGATAVR